MEIKAIDQKENTLLNRREVSFEVSYQGEATPNRISVRSKLSAIINEEANLTVIRRIENKFGLQKSVGVAYVYPDLETRDKIESKHIIKRFNKGEK